MQNVPKAMNASIIDGRSSTSPEKMSAVNTKMFFTHCVGRASLISAIIDCIDVVWYHRSLILKRIICVFDYLVI